MHIDTDASTIANTTESEQEADDLRSLREVLTRLQEFRPDITDDDLHRAVTRYLTHVQDRETTDLETHIPTRLGRMERDHRMYRHPQSTSPEDEFPEECIDAGCEHVPNACALLARNENRESLTRILERSEATDEKMRALRELANEINCPVLHDLVAESEPSASIRKLGTLLVMAVEDRVLRREPASEVLAEAARLEAAEELDVAEILAAASGDRADDGGAAGPGHDSAEQPVSGAAPDGGSPVGGDG